MLGYPTHDPHGDPIPSRDGRVPPSSTDPLTTFSEGESVLVHRLADSDPATLARLESFGILPRVRITLVNQPASDGSVRVRVGGVEHELSPDDAQSVYGVLART